MWTLSKTFVVFSDKGTKPDMTTSIVDGKRSLAAQMPKEVTKVRNVG